MGKTVALGRSVPPYPWYSHRAKFQDGFFSSESQSPWSLTRVFRLEKTILFGCWSAAKGGGALFSGTIHILVKKTHSNRIPCDIWFAIRICIYIYIYVYAIHYFIYTCMYIYIYNIYICVHVIAKASCLASTRYLNGQERSQRSHAWLVHTHKTAKGCLPKRMM